MTDWKSVANAIVHDGYDPNLRLIYFRCEICGNAYLEIISHTDTHRENCRETGYITYCPRCHAFELNAIRTIILRRPRKNKGGDEG